MSGVTAEWASVSEEIAIVARETGEFWFLRLDEFRYTHPFGTPMNSQGSPGSTAGLLRGAIVLGIGSTLVALGLEGPAIARRRPQLTLPGYVLDLVASYHNSSRTVGNYLTAAKRFRELDRLDLASYLERHAREENGHERLALRDLRALNLPAERIVENLIPDGVASLCELFDRLSSSDYPVGCIGYSYFFESSAAKRTKADVDAMQALCPEGVDASRFMRAHSSLSSEVDHARDMIDFIARLPAPDRTEIVKATYETAMTASNGLGRGGPKSESAMWAEIQAAAGEEIRLSA